MLLGDFSTLAENYALYRPGYSPTVCRVILGLVGKTGDQISAVDVGAGTGIWSRELAANGVVDLIAIEPNQQMRDHRKIENAEYTISWREGSGEKTGLEAECVDLVTMASSFHWTDFDEATREFCRVLKPNGIFSALWNTRFLESSPILLEIEVELNRYLPNKSRVSSGRSEFCNSLTQKLSACGLFEDVIQLNGYHTERMTINRYIGIWRSVNEIQAQIGAKNFTEFLDYIVKKLADREFLHAKYETRAWITRKS